MARDLPTSRSRHDGGGFTLLELILVLVILSLLMAITWPALMRPLSRGLAHEAARQLAQDLAEARMMAIDSGCTLAMRFEMGGSRYIVVSAEADSEEDNGSLGGLGESLSEGSGDRGLSDGLDRQSDFAEAAPAANDDGRLRVLIPTSFEAELPNDVVFGDPLEAQEDGSFLDLFGAQLDLGETESVETILDESAGDLSSVEWSTPVLFFPTGRSDNAELFLQSSDGYSVTVTVRGLTGAVMIGPIIAARVEVDEFGAPDESVNQVEPSVTDEVLGETNEVLSDID